MGIEDLKHKHDEYHFWNFSIIRNMIYKQISSNLA